MINLQNKIFFFVIKNKRTNLYDCGFFIKNNCVSVVASQFNKLIFFRISPTHSNFLFVEVKRREEKGKGERQRKKKNRENKRRREKEKEKEKPEILVQI